MRASARGWTDRPVPRLCACAPAAGPSLRGESLRHPGRGRRGARHRQRHRPSARRASPPLNAWKRSSAERASPSRPAPRRHKPRSIHHLRRYIFLHKNALTRSMHAPYTLWPGDAGQGRPACKAITHPLVQSQQRQQRRKSQDGFPMQAHDPDLDSSARSACSSESASGRETSWLFGCGQGPRWEQSGRGLSASSSCGAGAPGRRGRAATASPARG